MIVRNKNPERKKKGLLKEKTIPKLKPLERAAQDVLKNARRPLTTNEVANFSGMSWQSARKHLKGLHRKRKSVHTEKRGTARFWFIKKK
ncbi:hypothetical protein AYK24_10725 [Thermoplasmatales archaeon SG8-52-4]|nr:MAG: hypothetical protein AYK24_10725 [Thermoplasmatales archaeon SG8-52-4]